MNYSRDLINKYGSKNRVDWNSWCVEKEKQHRFLYQVKTSIETKEEKQTLTKIGTTLAADLPCKKCEKFFREKKNKVGQNSELHRERKTVEE